MLEIGYVGTGGWHLLRIRSPNQALSASPANPIRGAVSNTVANIGLRVPIQGVAPQSMTLVESEGMSSYNGLEVSLTKRFSRGLQMLASYTFSKTLDTDGSNINGTSAGNALTRGKSKFSNATVGPGQLRSNTSLCIERGVCVSFAFGGILEGPVWRLVHFWCAYAAIWNRTHNLVQQLEQRLWNF